MKLEKTLLQVEEVSQGVGDFIERECLQFDPSNIEYKGKNNLVSYVDKEAEKKLVSELKKIVPGAGFIVEEGTDSSRGDSYQWIVDPLDGTTNFMHGVPVFAISIALMKEDQIVLGLINHISIKDIYKATIDTPAFCNLQEIRVSPNQNLGEALIATGFPYEDFNALGEFLEVLKKFMQSTHGVRRMGSAAIDLAYVARGIYDGFFEYNLNAWDVAAGALIVERAGGKVTDFEGGGNFVFGKQILAGNEVHGDMMNMINNFSTK